jgi:hypothetical protein
MPILSSGSAGKLFCLYYAIQAQPDTAFAKRGVLAAYMADGKPLAAGEKVSHIVVPACKKHASGYGESCYQSAVC